MRMSFGLANRSVRERRTSLGYHRRGWWLAGGLLGLGAGIWVVAGLHLYHDSQRVKRLELGIHRALKTKNWGRLNQDTEELYRVLVGARAALAEFSLVVPLPQVGGWYQSLDHLLQAGIVTTGAMRRVLPSVEHVWQAIALPPHQGGMFVRARLWTALAEKLGRAGPQLQSAGRYLQQVGEVPHIPSYPFAVWGRREYQIGTLAKAAPVLSKALGLTQSVRYLMLFQDSGELRASGGFVAGYGFLNVTHGHLTISNLGAIQGLSRSVQVGPPAPWTLHHFFGYTRLTLLNANLSPNVPTSSRMFEDLYDTAKGHRFLSGVLWVNTWMADRLLRLTGPISVSLAGHSLDLAPSNLAMEQIAYRYGSQGTRAVLDGIAGVLEEVVAHGSAAQKKALWKALGWGVRHQDLILFSNNRDLELWLARMGMSGSLDTRPGNFLEVVDDNFGAHKDNFYLQQRLQITVLKRPQVRQRRSEIIRLSYWLPRAANGWLIVPYIGWISLYLPWGTKVVSVSGKTCSHTRVSKDRRLHKTIVGFELHVPAFKNLQRNRASVTIHLALPRSLKDPSDLTLGLQPGLRGEQVTVGDRTLWQDHLMHLRVSPRSG